MLSTGIIGNSPVKLPFPPVGCDLPEQGGIGGNLGKDEPKPYVLEERPKQYNFRTGKWEYIDKKIPNGWIA